MILKILFFIFAIFFGLFMIIFGGMDDSPGAQGIGLLAIIITIFIIIKGKRGKIKPPIQNQK